MGIYILERRYLNSVAHVICLAWLVIVIEEMPEGMWITAIRYFEVDWKRIMSCEVLAAQIVFAHAKRKRQYITCERSNQSRLLC